MKNHLKIALVLITGVLALSELAFASEYPADQSAFTACAPVQPAWRSQGVVKVCRAIQIGYGLAVLEISYSGALDRSSHLHAWVRMNYQNGPREGTFQLTVPRSEISPATLRITGGCIVGMLGGCAQSGTQEMRTLLMWAQKPNGTPNTIDLDIAFFDDNGHWDNNGGIGKNYHFHINE